MQLSKLYTKGQYDVLQKGNAELCIEFPEMDESQINHYYKSNTSQSRSEMDSIFNSNTCGLLMKQMHVLYTVKQ